MKSTLRRIGHHAAGAGLVALFMVCGLASAQTLTLARKIELPAVHGRIDHMAVDAEGGRVFVAALASDSLEVIDLRSGQRTDRIRSLHEPQGVLYLAHARRLVVANGSGGGVQAFADGKAPSVAAQPALGDADNLRWEAAGGTVYVGFGSALAELDADSLRIKRRIELMAHPEAFQIEQSGRRIFVNVPNAGHIAVVNRDSGKVETTWLLDGATRNFPMALDEAGHRLFVVTRWPAQLLVYDTRSGHRVARAAACGDADDVFFDDVRQQLYVVCGEGRVEVMHREGEQYITTAQVQTSPGARTGLFVPDWATLFIAAPARDGALAQVLEYRIR